MVLAVEAPEVERLLGIPPRTVSRGESCLYFSASAPPLREPFLVVNAEGKGPITNLCVPSQVAPTYAPKGRSLVSVTVIGELRPGIFVCGEYGSLPSIQWALVSGRLAADSVSAALAQQHRSTGERVE